MPSTSTSGYEQTTCLRLSSLRQQGQRGQPLQRAGRRVAPVRVAGGEDVAGVEVRDHPAARADVLRQRPRARRQGQPDACAIRAPPTTCPPGPWPGSGGSGVGVGTGVRAGADAEAAAVPSTASRQQSAAATAATVRADLTSTSRALRLRRQEQVKAAPRVQRCGDESSPHLRRPRPAVYRVARYRAADPEPRREILLRRVRGMGLVATALVGAMTLAACGSSDSGSSSGGSGSGGSAAPSNLKIGMAYDIGGRGDKSFNDSAAVGLDSREEELQPLRTTTSRSCRPAPARPTPTGRRGSSCWPSPGSTRSWPSASRTRRRSRRSRRSTRT